MNDYKNLPYLSCDPPIVLQRSAGNLHDPGRGQHLAGLPERLAYSIAGLCEATSVRRQLVYDEIATGRLVARKIGRRTVILPADAERWLATAKTIEPHQLPDPTQVVPSETIDGDKPCVWEVSSVTRGCGRKATRPPGTHR